MSSQVPAASDANALANTLALPCVARKLFWVSGPDDVLAALEWSASEGLPLMPLGEGSNVVLPTVLEAGVLKVADRSMTVLEDRGPALTLRVGAGKPWHDLVSDTLDLGYFGLENLALIPGLVGAAPVQNIGAYGVECDKFVLAVHGIDLVHGQPRTLSNAECEFAYRDSVFKSALRDRFLISAVDFRLSRTPNLNIDYPALSARVKDHAVTPRAVFDAVVALRQERLPNPSITPNAGSFFKNPLLSTGKLHDLQRIAPEVPVYPVSETQCKVSAAWLIERAGLRGYRQRGAAVSEQHALVLVTHSGAVQNDVLDLANHVQSVVRERFAVSLEAEPRIYA
ncbi:MAG: UDP-N-acetylmuramate dehydrogenase [Congregibacter sp.]|nr:UDP-N-acetylmuramate dehydrogenase [Congregibacter sp.]